MKNKKFLVCVVTLFACLVILVMGVLFGPFKQSDELVITFAQAGNESAAFEWHDQSADKAAVYFRESGTSAYTRVDNELIRQIDLDTARVDIVGLKVGVQTGLEYDFKIVASTGATKTMNRINIAAYDRSGYAHFNYKNGVGAYKDDGSPKDNAVIVYVNESNKNTVTASLNGEIYTGLVDILKHAGNQMPLIVRIVGTVGAATWHEIEYNAGKDLSPDQVYGVNNKYLLDFYQIDRKDKDVILPQAQLIKDGFNDLDTSVYSELNGLLSQIKYNATVDEFDSRWNDCLIQNVSNVTVEGIGTDARIFQWGMTFSNCDSIEVRNLTFEAYPEDACSADGNDRNASNFSDFQHGNIWVHHNTFKKGINYWDVCNQQDKHDGDGSTDFKGLKGITLSYNVYSHTCKTGLIGGDNSETTANVTLHHNLYNQCERRLPLARQVNVHLYNNYYNETTSCDLSLRANAYAFVENCYFESKNKCPVELQHDATYGDGWVKIVGCVIDASKIIIYDGVNKNTNLYVGTDRNKQLNTTNQFGSNFDTSTTDFYYDGTQTVVTQMLTAQEVQEQLPSVAGVMKHVANILG